MGYKKLLDFIKTRHKKRQNWQVNFTVKEDAARGEIILNPNSLVNLENETNGRFALCPTEYIYNCLLMDQIGVNVY